MKLELLNFIELENYPSGSGIEFYDDKIYVVGDHSRNLLILGKKWNKPTLLNLFETTEKKTPDPTNSDLESMSVLSIDKKPHLLIIGTGSTDHRNKAVFVTLKNNTIRWADLSIFYNRIKAAGIAELNIEGIAEVYDYLVLVNRGNVSNPVNHLIITKADFWKNQDKASLQTIIIDFESAGLTGTIGVSGITYSDKHEDLFLTIFSMEAGVIGKGYLAVIENLYRKIGREKGKIKVNQLIDLTAADQQFSHCKIESVCIQSEKDHSVKLQLVANNDLGNTLLFKVGLGW